MVTSVLDQREKHDEVSHIILLPSSSNSLEHITIALKPTALFPLKPLSMLSLKPSSLLDSHLSQHDQAHISPSFQLKAQTEAQISHFVLN